MREGPPGHRVKLRVLGPGEQQQQAEHGLDIDGDKEKRADVETHRSPTRQYVF